jgi:cytochrome b6-f complex iron-sulfur subunit
MKSRREFLKSSKNGVILACGVGAAGLLLESCGTAKYVPYGVDQNLLSLDKLEFGKRDFVLVDFPKLLAPLYVKKVSETEYRAFLMLCTHNQCTVMANGAIMACPCHGAEFSSLGKVLQGPAEEDLAEFPVEVKGEKLIINASPNG